MRRAFTLIELLVVVSIIALLIAILLPALSNVKYTSTMTVCSSNLRQVGIGVMAYTTDNDDWYPNGYVSGYGKNADGQYGRDNLYSWAVYQKDGSGHRDMVAILQTTTAAWMACGTRTCAGSWRRATSAPCARPTSSGTGPTRASSPSA